MKIKSDRRSFLKKVGLTSVTATILPGAIEASEQPMGKAKISEREVPKEKAVVEFLVLHFVYEMNASVLHQCKQCRLLFFLITGN